MGVDVRRQISRLGWIKSRLRAQLFGKRIERRGPFRRPRRCRVCLRSRSHEKPVFFGEPRRGGYRHERIRRPRLIRLCERFVLAPSASDRVRDNKNESNSVHGNSPNGNRTRVLALRGPRPSR